MQLRPNEWLASGSIVSLTRVLLCTREKWLLCTKEKWLLCTREQFNNRKSSVLGGLHQFVVLYSLCILHSLVCFAVQCSILSPLVNAAECCIVKWRQTSPIHWWSVLWIEAVAIPGVAGWWVHTVQPLVWKGTPLPLCMSTDNGQWYGRSGNMVRAPRLWWLWYSNGQLTGTSPPDAHTHQSLTQLTLSPPLLTNQQNLVSSHSDVGQT